MSGAIAWAVVALGIGVVVVRRRSLGIALVTLQALLLAIGALAAEHSASRVGEVLALGLRGLGLGVLLIVVMRRTREAAPVRAGVAPLVRAAFAVGLALALAGLVPTIGLDSRSSERAVLSLVAFGLVTCATRRATLFQIAGLVMVENGLALAAFSARGGGSVVIELGAALDLILIAVVATAFHERIFATFGAGDTKNLRSLRD